ncbi:MAG: AMP-binding protein [Bacteroidales bacterium]|nr:AMP-binding protein [Bacteroidales bacterium]
MLLECIGFPESLGYNLPTVARMAPDTDPFRLRDSIVKMLEAHPNFRMRIAFDGPEPVQYISDDIGIDVPIYEKSEEEAERFIEYFVRPFNILESPLLRIAVVRTPQAVYFVSDLHHLITDGTTQFLAATEVAARYDGLEPGKENTTFPEYVAGEPARGSEESREYYRKLYEGVEPSRLRASAGNPMGRIVRRSEYVDACVADEFCRRQGFAPNYLFHAAYCAALSVWLHDPVVCFSTLSHGRYDRSLRGTFGMLIKTFPVLRRIDPSMSVREFVLGFKSEMISQLRHSDYSFLEFCADRGFVPETMFSFQGPAILEKFSIGGSEAYVTQPHSGCESVSGLSTVVYLRDGRYEIRVECSDAIHDAEFLATFASTVRGSLESLMEHPDGKMGDISVIAGAGLPQGRSAPADYPDVVALIDAQAVSDPDGIAVCCPPESLTYAALKSASDTLAARLRSEGFSSGSCAAILQSRSCGSIVSMLGVLKAGGCYVPMEPDLPEERRRAVIADSGASMILTDNGIVHNGPSQAGPDDLAYIIYSSGSTGHPKGVEIPRRALSAFVHSISGVLDISCRDRICCHSSFAFDASVEDIFPVLCAGGTLYIMPEGIRRDPSAIVGFINDHKITGGNFTTRFGTVLLERYDLPGLRYMVLGGEKMNVYPRRNRHLRLFNTYGPTEFTVDATSFELDPSREYDDIPIGRPLPGVDAYVTDCRMHPVPDGVPGELCLGGAQMAAGYRGLGDKTQEAFGSGLYRTGDIVVRRDGLLHFIGRRDTQIKLRGFRIDTGEIEALAADCPGVEQAVVRVNSDGTQLGCYYTGGAEEEALRKHLAARVPAYMVPDAFASIPRIPLTANGKTDLGKLPPLSPRVSGSAVMPKDKPEEALYAAACKVLGHSRFGVTDDLFLSGLNSIGVINLEVEAGKLGCRVRVSDILSLKTVRALARLSAESLPMSAYGEHTGKPVAVLVSGVTWPEELEPLCLKLSLTHDLFVIEPVSDHLGLASTAEGYAGVYAELVKGIGRPVSLLVGHSFGGELALLLGLRLPSAPELYMLDTSATINVPRNVAGMVEATPMAQDLKSYWTAYLQRSRPAVELHDDKSLRPYPGPCTLFYSFRREANARKVAGLIPGIRLKKVRAGHIGMLRADFVERMF